MPASSSPWDLALAGVEPGAGFDTEVGRRAPTMAAGRSGSPGVGAVERREEAVPGGVDLTDRRTEAELVVALALWCCSKQLAPGTVAEPLLPAPSTPTISVNRIGGEHALAFRGPGQRSDTKRLVASSVAACTSSRIQVKLPSNSGSSTTRASRIRSAA